MVSQYRIPLTNILTRTWKTRRAITTFQPLIDRANPTARLTMADDLDVRDVAHIALEDKVSGGGRGGRRRDGKRGGGGGGVQGRDVQVSRTLSKLLRHQAENAGIQLDDEGYASLERVLAWGPLKSLKVTFKDVKSIVDTNDKQRFAIKLRDASTAADSTSPADYLIRANQGHSIKIESSSILKPMTIEEGNIPSRVLHGTYFAFWPKIVESGGLKPMGRTHVHCSTGTPEEGVVSGMRRDAELLVEIDVERSMKEGGLKWWRSENDVVLTEGDEEGMLSSKYFKKVVGRQEDVVGVMWEDGEWKADLPDGLKMRVPQGKTRGGGRGRGGQGRGGRSL